MKFKLNISKLYSLALISSIGVFLACTPEKFDEDLGPVPTASFTVTPIEGMNKYVLTSTSQGGFMYSWDKGTGAFKKGSETDTAFFEKKGSYSVKLMVFGKGGSATAEQTIIVEHDLGGDNVIADGDMSKPDAWTVSSAGMTLTSAEFTNGVLKLSNGTAAAQTNVLVWKTVEVEAGKEYIFSAKVKTSTATNSWFEVYLGKAAPSDGSDYTDNKILALSSWTGGCYDANEGDLADLACAGEISGKSGSITFAESGTVYLVIKAGSWDGNLGADGTTIDDIKLTLNP